MFLIFIPHYNLLSLFHNRTNSFLFSTLMSYTEIIYTYISICVYEHIILFNLFFFLCVCICAVCMMCMCDTRLCDIYVCDLCLCDMYVYYECVKCVCVMCMCVMGVCACMKAYRLWHIWKYQSIMWCGHYPHIWVSFRDKLRLSRLHSKQFYLLEHLISLPTYFKSRLHIWQKMWYLSLNLLYFAYNDDPVLPIFLQMT